MNVWRKFSSNCETALRYFIPPPAWRLPVIIILGIFVGLAIFLIRISNAVSYLSDDPRACINCHVMTTQYATWERSAHNRVATCVDCHVPHDNPVHKYYFKAKDGLRHAKIFTLRQEPQVIRIKEDGREAVFHNCLRCHGYALQEVASHQYTYDDVKNGDARVCWECHRETPHGRVRSLSSAPYALVPELPPVVPIWMEELIAQASPETEEEMPWNV